MDPEYARKRVCHVVIRILKDQPTLEDEHIEKAAFGPHLDAVLDADDGRKS